MAHTCICPTPSTYTIGIGLAICADLADLLGDANGDEGTMREAPLVSSEGCDGHAGARNEVRQQTQQIVDASAAEPDSTCGSHQDLMHAANGAPDAAH